MENRLKRQDEAKVSIRSQACIGAAHNPAAARTAGSNPAPATKSLAAQTPLRKIQPAHQQKTIQRSSVVERSAVKE